MKKIFLAIIIILSLTLIASGSAFAKTTNYYTTQKIKLSKDLTIKHNTKVLVIKSGKKKSLIEYKGEKYIVKTKHLHKKKAVNKYKGKSFKRVGHCKWNGCSWTWYTQRRLPGKSLKIPGRHVDKRGFVCDKDGYIVLASSIGYKKCKKILPTPFGKYGKVYDTNGTWNYGWRDCYTDWTP